MSNRQDAAIALERIASIQGGYFTSAQAREAGYNYRHQYHHSHRRNWIKIDRGLYRLRAFPHVEHEEWIRWSFWANGKGVISHESALALHDLGVFLPRKVHITVPPNFRKKPPEDVTLHRAIVLPEDIEQGEGYSVTKPLRSILDTARYADASILAQSIRDAMDRGIVWPEDIEKGIQTLPRRAAKNLRLAWADAREKQ